MDAALWNAHRGLSAPARARWVRTWLEHETVPDDLLRAVRDLRNTEEWARELAALDDLCERHGVRRIDALDPRFPRAAFAALVDPPGTLFVRGRVELLGAAPSVAVVGARRGTLRGVRVARSLGEGLARAGVMVVSGMALGVDAAAQRGALEASGTVIAVLAGGPEVARPAANTDLYRQLCARGLVVSESPPEERPHRASFVARNRIVAALGAALVVVEAGERSGTRSTVDFALDLGREVMGVPGPVDCPHAVGVNALLREGATFVRGASDVLETLGLDAPTRSTGVLGLGGTPESTVAIARRTGRDLVSVLVALAEAEASGRVRRMPGDRWIATDSG